MGEAVLQDVGRVIDPIISLLFLLPSVQTLFCLASSVQNHVRLAAATKSCIFFLSLPPSAFSIPLATSTA
jgi:hypothetical protein